MREVVAHTFKTRYIYKWGRERRGSKTGCQCGENRNLKPFPIYKRYVEIDSFRFCKKCTRISFGIRTILISDIAYLFFSQKNISEKCKV